MRKFYQILIDLILFLTIFSFHSYTQSTYPPILIDSNAIAEKVSYLTSIVQSNSYSSTPNIIIILVDDLGKNDITLYDSDGVSTPNIDQLGKEGVVFTEAYSTSAVCYPSRCGMITGRYQQRFGSERMIMGRYAKNKFEHFVFKNFIRTRPMYLIDPWYSPPVSEMQKQGLPESEISLFEIMSHAGYKTACIGKWHMGYNEPSLPQNKNLDEFYGFYEAFSLYAPKSNKEIVNYKHKIFQNKHMWRQKRKGPSAIVHNGKEIIEEEYLTTKFAKEACRFIQENEKNPFFLYVPFSAPHTPFQAPKSYYDKFAHIQDKNTRVYYAMIAALDDAIGEILKQVQESELEENTLIFFASDNGGATYTGATDNGNLKGGKITNFEGGLNVPFIMKWKGVLPAETQYHKPISLLDIFSTSISSCNINPPHTVPIDGVNLVPFILGENTQAPHDNLFWRTDFNKTVRNGKWKLLVNSRDSILFLYDLEIDKEEKYDLKAKYPEVVKILLTKLTDWEKELKPPAWPGVMEYEQEIDGVKMRFAL